MPYLLAFLLISLLSLSSAHNREPCNPTSVQRARSADTFVARPEQRRDSGGSSQVIKPIEVARYCAKAAAKPSVKPSQTYLYTLIPSNIGGSLDPLGASIEFAVASERYPADVRLFVTLGYDRGLRTWAAPYGFARYELDGPSGQGHVPMVYSLQAGLWPYDPHRAGVHVGAFGVRGGLQVSGLGPIATRAKIDVGLIRLLGSDSGFLLDGAGELTAAHQLGDRWGYRLSGWQGTLAGLWSATASEPSLALWADASYTFPGRFPIDAEFRFGYRPVWPIPITSLAELAGVATLGTRLHVPAQLPFDEGLIELKRATLEPRLRLWSDTALNVGADLTLSLDADIDRPLSLSGTVGFAEKMWFRLSLRASP